MNPVHLMNFGRRQIQTTQDEFMSILVEMNSKNFDGFLKAIKYEDGMKNKWSIKEIQGTYSKVIQIYNKTDRVPYPALATLLGSACETILQERTAQKELRWYVDKARELISTNRNANIDSKTGKYIPREDMENCIKAYSDIVGGLAGLLERLDTRHHTEFVEFFETSLPVLQNGHPQRLTTAHRALVWIAVQRKLYHIVSSLIDNVIFEVSPSLPPLDYLMYFYYAGLAHIGLKNFEKALDHLSMCSIVPGDNLSLIQIDAHKKYILVSLIQNGKVTSLPTFASHRLKKTLTKACRSYLDLEEVFDQGSEALNKVIARNMENYEKDHNQGLVAQVAKAQNIARVKKLKNVYASCSIAVAAEQAQISDPQTAKKIILHLIRLGELHASIDANDIITFEASPKLSQQQYADMFSRVQKVVQLTKTAEQMFYDTRISEEYVKQTTPQLQKMKRELLEEPM